jgi:predicted RND superfamily exporter protein
VNFINIVMFPSLIGLGVDNGVYFYQRYVEDGPQNILKVLWSTGPAICLTTFTSLIGYGTLVFTRHGALSSMGWLAVIGLSVTWLTALVMFPALLQVLEDRQKPVQGV